MFAYHDDYYRIPCADTLCNALTAPSTIKVEHGHNPSPNVTYTGVLSDKTYVEARVSGFYGKDHGDPLQDVSVMTHPSFVMHQGVVVVDPGKPEKKGLAKLFGGK